jgi:hypothetical protein
MISVRVLNDGALYLTIDSSERDAMALQTGGSVSDGDLRTIRRRDRPRQVDADVDLYCNLGGFGN